MMKSLIPCWSPLWTIRLSSGVTAPRRASVLRNRAGPTSAPMNIPPSRFMHPRRNSANRYGPNTRSGSQISQRSRPQLCQQQSSATTDIRSTMGNPQRRLVGLSIDSLPNVRSPRSTRTTSQIRRCPARISFGTMTRSTGLSCSSPSALSRSVP